MLLSMLQQSPSMNFNHHSLSDAPEIQYMLHSSGGIVYTTVCIKIYLLQHNYNGRDCWSKSKIFISFAGTYWKTSLPCINWREHRWRAFMLYSPNLRRVLQFFSLSPWEDRTIFRRPWELHLQLEPQLSWVSEWLCGAGSDLSACSLFVTGAQILTF